jgi:hypothetical protein
MVLAHVYTDFRIGAIDVAAHQFAEDVSYEGIGEQNLPALEGSSSSRGSYSSPPFPVQEPLAESSGALAVRHRNATNSAIGKHSPSSRIAAWFHGVPAPKRSPWPPPARLPLPNRPNPTSDILWRSHRTLQPGLGVGSESPASPYDYRRKFLSKQNVKNLLRARVAEGRRPPRVQRPEKHITLWFL